MVVRPLAAYRWKPIRRPQIRKSIDQDMITIMLESEVLTMGNLRQSLKVLKPAASRPNSAAADTQS